MADDEPLVACLCPARTAGLAGRPGNPVHHVIASGFRGERQDVMMCSIWNPSYDPMGKEMVRISKLHHFKPVRLVYDDSAEQEKLYARRPLS